MNEEPDSAPAKQLAAALKEFSVARGLALKDMDLVPRYVMSRMSALESDVISAVEDLLRSYAEAQDGVEALRTLAGHVPFDEKAYREAQEQTRRAITAFKTVYIFVRALQDAICGFMHATNDGAVGKYVSMNKHLGSGKAIRLLVDEHLPAYVPWFERWKDRRDKIKVGAQFALLFDATNELSISFSYPQDEVLVSEQTIGLGEIVIGLRMSADLTKLAFSQFPPDQVIQILW